MSHYAFSGGKEGERERGEKGERRGREGREKGGKKGGKKGEERGEKGGLANSKQQTKKLGLGFTMQCFPSRTAILDSPKAKVVFFENKTRIAICISLSRSFGLSFDYFVCSHPRNTGPKPLENIDRGFSELRRQWGRPLHETLPN